MSAVAGSGLIVLALMLLLGVSYLAEHILFALAAYHDARAHGNQEAVIWGLAIGFLGLIPGIIYLCVRGSGRRMVRCTNCGYPHDASDFCCPKCGERNSAAPQVDPMEQELEAKARKEMIAGIAVIAAAIVLTILTVMFFSFAVMRHGLFYKGW